MPLLWDINMSELGSRRTQNYDINRGVTFAMSLKIIQIEIITGCHNEHFMFLNRFIVLSVCILQH